MHQTLTKQAHEHITSYWCWLTTETTPTLLYQLSLQTNDLQPTVPPSSHVHVQYTTIVTSHKTLLDLLDVRVQLQFKHTHTPCYELWDSNGICQSRAAQHQHVLQELQDGPWCFQIHQFCGAVSPSLGPGIE